MSAAWRNGLRPEATAVYARWWQLETWLRELVYVERSARHGRSWADDLPPTAAHRESADREHGYMATPDATARLAYLDVGPLFELITDDWDLYSSALIDRAVWDGRVRELKRIRNRIGHCRRPHGDDLGRVEQTLRDLEGGTLGAVSSYNRQFHPQPELDDPVVEAWLREDHPDARRLVGHADRNYDVRFWLTYSRRPWSEPRAEGEMISGRPGYLWHAHWVMAGGRPVDLRSLWEDSYMTAPRDLMVFLTATDPFSIQISFAAVDEPSSISDAIGHAFDGVLTNPDHRWGDSLEEIERWTRRMEGLDAKMQISTTWAIVDDSTTPITIFDS